MKLADLFESRNIEGILDRYYRDLKNDHLPVAWCLSDLDDAKLKKEEIPDEEKFKAETVKRILYQINHPPWNVDGHEITMVMKDCVDMLRGMGFDWSELDVIEKSAMSGKK